jgi:hypothetical protein
LQEVPEVSRHSAQLLVGPGAEHEHVLTPVSVSVSVGRSGAPERAFLQHDVGVRASEAE